MTGAGVLAVAGKSAAEVVAAVGFAVLLAGSHLAASHLRFLQVIPRSRWLSGAGGAAVAYVFVHLLPELRVGQEQIEQTSWAELRFVEHHVYLVALVGLAAFYGMERLAKRSREKEPGQGEEASPGVFWVHMVSFSIYNALIGYLLLHRESRGLWGLVVYGLAMTLHLAVNDYGLWQHHKRRYARIGRYVLMAAVAVGLGVGFAVDVPHGVLALLFSFLAGGIILNVLKEELPEERESRFWAFAVGAAAYTLLLLAV